MNQKIAIAILASSILIAFVHAATADAAGVKTVDGSGNVTECLQGHYLSGTAGNAAATCPPCQAGTTTTASNSATSCTACTAGNFCTAATASNSVNHAPTACTAGNYCPASASVETACTAGNYCPGTSQSVVTPCTAGNFCPGTGNSAVTACTAGGYCPGTGNSAVTWCPQDTPYAPASASASTACAAVTTQATGCLNYNASAGGSTACTRAGKGYYLNANTVTACFHTQCATCSGSTFATCTTVGAGFYKNTNASTVAACAEGCNACTFSTTDSTTVCNKGKAGYYLASGVATKCAAGTGAALDNATASCTPCTATNCTACLDPAFCTSCSANFLLTASAGTCAAYTGTKHGTCLGADGSASTNCQSCDATKNREFPMDTTTSTRKTYGECVCKETFVDQSALSASAPDFTCVSCGVNAKTCTIAAAGITITACNTGFFLTSTTVGNKCIAKDATDKPEGIFFDATTSKFVACHATCKTCTAAGADKCAACKEPPSTWVEPTQEATNYATYIQGTRALINATCLDECPVGWVANEARTDCVADQGNSNGLLAIISLILIFFSLI